MHRVRTYFFFIFLSSAQYLAQSSNEVEEEDIKRSQFPDKFLFGTSTSAYQVEGAYLEDGKGLNNWDVFSHIPGNMKNDDNGDVADDHYRRYMEDVELLHSIGVNAYRFSISWARLLPRGRFGGVNPSGIMFYNKIIDNLLLRGIEPFVTMHHHDFPQELHDRYGGWLSPQMQEDFVHLAEVCYKSFGERVKYWTTINEPNLFADMAFIRGCYPPAHCSPPFGLCSAGNSDIEPLIVMHNMLLAHAKAVKLFREKFQVKQGGSIGIVVSAQMFEPLRDIEPDRQAVRRALTFNVGWTLDPLVFGDYPPAMRQIHGNDLPRFSPEEMKYVKGSVDFIGINHYSTFYAMDCIHSPCKSGGDRPIKGFVYTTNVRDGIPIGEQTGIPDFFVVPRGMEKIINYIKERYNNMPILVAENGYSPPVQHNVHVGDLLEDVKRIEFHKAYLAALAKAITDGANVRGYFVWALMDNLEWVEGYDVRFGLYYVDRQTLERTPKLSAKWYANFLTNSSCKFIPGSSKKKNNVMISRLGGNKYAEIL